MRGRGPREQDLLALKMHGYFGGHRTQNSVGSFAFHWTYAGKTKADVHFIEGGLGDAGVTPTH